MSANFGSPALYTGVTLESFQSVGTIPDDKDWLNSSDRYWEMDDEQALSIWVDIPSGPEADITLSDWMIEATSSLEQEIVDKPSLRAGGLLAVSWGLKNRKQIKRLALARVLSAVTDPWVRR